MLASKTSRTVLAQPRSGGCWEWGRGKAIGGVSRPSVAIAADPPPLRANL
ncbi:hypothetical protein [Phormidium sp. CCY1219]|nr:hypothetical protein [Phormidium sp. CCY1219]